MSACRVHIALLAALAVAPSGCQEPAAATAVVVELHSDLADEIALVEVVIRDADDRADGERYRFALGRKLAFPFSFSVLPPASGPGRRFVVVATGQSAAGEALVQAKADLAFSPGRTVGVALWLARRCKGVMCEAGKTCGTAGGSTACQGIPRPDPEPIASDGKPMATPVPDAGSLRDAGMRDAAPQPPDDATTAGSGGASGTGGSAGTDDAPDAMMPTTATECTTPAAHRWRKIADYPGTTTNVDLVELGASLVLSYRTCDPCQRRLQLLDADGSARQPQLDLRSDARYLVPTSGGPANELLIATTDPLQKIEVRGGELQTYRPAVALGNPTANWLGTSGSSAVYVPHSNTFGVVFVAHNADASAMGLYLTVMGADGSIHSYSDRPMLTTTTTSVPALAAGHDGRRFVALFKAAATQIAYDDGSAAKDTPVAVGAGTPLFARDRFAVFEQTGDRQTRKVFARSFDSNANLLHALELPIAWPADSEWAVSAIDEGFVFHWLHASDDPATRWTLRVLVTDADFNAVGELVEIDDVPYPELAAATRYLYGSAMVQTSTGLAYAAHVGGTAGTATQGSIQWLTMNCLPLP